MNATTFAIWFAAAWVCVVLLYCLFRVCGGRLADLLSCRCLSGPLCSCWGVGGRLEKADAEYPFGYDNQFYPPPQQLPIIIINQKDRRRDRRRDRRGDSGSSSSSSDSDSDEERVLRASDENERARSDGALLLQNRSQSDPRVAGPVVV